MERSGHGPVGFGTDLNEFAGWPSPRFGGEACSGGKIGNYNPNSTVGRLGYPFAIRATGVNIPLDHSQVGEKEFDFNTDGFALPDMVADFEALGMKSEELDPLFLSAKATSVCGNVRPNLASH